MTAKKVRKPGKAGIAGISLLLAVTVVANGVAVHFSSYLDNLFKAKLGDAEASAQTLEIGQQVANEVVEEGVVLLQNENSALPFAADEKINVFGWQSTSPIYGGTGSGTSDTSSAIDFYQGLTNAGIDYNADLKAFYDGLGLTRPEQSGYTGSDYTMVEADPSDYTDDLMTGAKDYSNTAVIYLSRIGGEGGDCPKDMYAAGWSDTDNGKHYLELSDEEEALFDLVCNQYAFDKVVVVINSSNAMELGFLDTYKTDACVLIGGPGATGCEAVGNILAGNVNPSGKLTDTWIYDLTMEPTYYNLGDYTYTNATYNSLTFTGGIGDAANYKFIDYEEGIYVGYRYYETRFIDNETGLCDEDAYNGLVQFPFGYGLSYSTFEQKITNHSVDENGTVTVDVEVTNTGDVAGKEVVELYYTAPYTVGGIEKSHVVLGGFDKTEQLEPGAAETVTITMNAEDMASYDYSGVKAANGAYVLEAGDYEIKVMSDAHHVLDSFTYTVNEDIVYDEDHDGARSTDAVAATNLFADCADDGTGTITYFSRADWEGTVPSAFPEDREAPQALLDMLNAPLADEGLTVTTGADNDLVLNDLIGADYDDERWQQLVEQMSVAELTSIVGLGGHQTIEVSSVEKAATKDENGPTGISAMQPGDPNGASYCAEPVMAATWNTELINELGVALGNEMVAHGQDGLYGPAVNIHRSAFSGRNFEYYSEDGFLSGKMVAAEVAGVQSNGKTYAYMKHFAINDQEVNRIGGLMWINEQAMREIYLKGFELGVKEGKSLAMMGSINLLGGKWTGSNSNLNNALLKDEWGFKGFIVTDYVSGTYMNADAAIRGGVDTMDTYTGSMPTDTSDTSIYYMQQSAKDILRVTANSQAQEKYHPSLFATWVYLLMILDAIVLIIVILLIINRRKRAKLWAAQNPVMENEVSEERKEDTK